MLIKGIAGSLILLHCFIVGGCQEKPSIENIEVVEYTTKQFYHNDTALLKPFWVFKEKIWFYDSLAIEEVRQLNITGESKGTTVKSYDIRHYRFCDLRKKTIYEFRTFEESPQFLKKYSFNDSLPVIGGWGFNHIRKLDSLGIVEKVGDTLFHQRKCKRANIYKKINNIPYIISCVFDCSRKGTHFDLSPSLSGKAGCPLTFFYYSSPLRTGLHMSSEVILVSNQLTDEEKKVFNAWKKFSTLNPVN